MAKLLRLRRGTDTQHTTFTGAEGEVTVNTTNDSLHVHDGSTAGGRELARADLSNVSGTTEGGITVNGNLSLADNNKALFGTGSDLEIYHDGSNSFIKDSGTGNLRLQGTQLRLQNAAGTADYLAADDQGAVNISYNNAVKLATTSTGIDVTGTVTCDGMTCEGTATIQAGTGLVQIKDSDNTGINSTNVLSGIDSANTQKWSFGDDQTGSDWLYIRNYSTSDGIAFYVNGTDRAYITGSGHFTPGANNTYDLGTSSNQWRDGWFDGTVNCDGLTCDGAATIAAGTGELILKDSDDSGNNTSVYSTSVLRGRDSADNNKWLIGDTSSGNANVYLWNLQNGAVIFGTNSTDRCIVNESGHFQPSLNNTYDLGTSSERWRNVYTNDLNLSNEGGTNDVDGTWGSWTIQEGEDDLFLLNRRNGKKYKFNLSEVN